MMLKRRQLDRSTVTRDLWYMLKTSYGVVGGGKTATEIRIIPEF